MHFLYVIYWVSQLPSLIRRGVGTALAKLAGSVMVCSWETLAMFLYNELVIFLIRCMYCLIFGMHFLYVIYWMNQFPSLIRRGWGWLFVFKMASNRFTNQLFRFDFNHVK